MSLLNKTRVFKLKDKKIKVIFNVSDTDCQDFGPLVEGISENNLYFYQMLHLESIAKIDYIEVLLYRLGEWRSFVLEINNEPFHPGRESIQDLAFKVKNCEQEIFKKELLFAKTA